MIFSPWLIVGAILAAIAIAGGGYVKGSYDGVNRQKVADQMQLDQINRQLADQNAVATMLIQANAKRILALLNERDKLKLDLERTHVKNQKITDDLRLQLSVTSLLFRTAPGTECGPSNPGGGTASGNPASTPASTLVLIPEPTAGNLKQLAYEADQLADAFRECYSWVNSVK